MRRVAEIIYIVESEREAFLKGAITPDLETQKVQWLCGVRKQQYFLLNEYIFMTFEYKGDHFAEDMQKMSAYLESKGRLVTKRRKDVPVDERATTNWWAPVKRVASLLETKPFMDEEDPWEEEYQAMLDGGMRAADPASAIAYDENDWDEGILIFQN